MERNDKCWYKDICKLDCHNCVRYRTMCDMLERSGLPKAQWYPKKLVPTTSEDKITFGKLKDIQRKIDKYVTHGYSIFLSSIESGTGKTSWAIKMLLSYFDKIWSMAGNEVNGMFIHVPTLLCQLKNFNNPLSEEYIENIKNCDVVIWDDIATSTLTDYEYNQLLILIDARINNRKTNIYTSNVVTKDELIRVLGARLASRVYNTSIVAILTGKDARGIEL